MSGRRSSVLAALAALLAAAAICASALAAGPGYDHSFGHGGRRSLTPAKPPGVTELKYQEWLAAADGGVYVLASAECRECRGRVDFLFRFRRGGGLDTSFGTHGYVRVTGSEAGFRLAVDARGRALVSIEDHGTQVRRFTLGGHPDPRFGHLGVVHLPKAVGGFLANAPTVSPMPGGGLLVSSENPEGGHGFTRFHLAELREGGSLVRTFGHDGVTSVDALGSFHLEYGPTPLPGGAVLIGALGCCTDKVSLTLVSARGRLDTRYDRTARRALRPLAVLKEDSEEGIELNAIIPRPDGGADLFGFVSPHGFDMRVKANGEADTTFGRRGLKVLPLPVSTAAAIPGGGFLLAGNEFNQQTVAYVARDDGSLDRSFRPTALGPGSFYPRATMLDGGDGAIAYGRLIPPEEDFRYRPVVAHLIVPTERKAGR